MTFFTISFGSKPSDTFTHKHHFGSKPHHHRKIVTPNRTNPRHTHFFPLVPIKSRPFPPVSNHVEHHSICFVPGQLRGIIDRQSGGVGLRRGRRHSTKIGVGDVLDFWRVLEVEPPQKLLLTAEMKILNDQPVRPGNYVLYWMQQSQRVETNHALEYAIQQANELDRMVIVVFGLPDSYHQANLRHCAFILD